MKSKKAIGFSILIISSLCIGYFFLSEKVYDQALKTEWLDERFPKQPDDNLIVPFGYTLGPWPQSFLGEPIVTQLTYHKGPPEKFLQVQTQIWKPIEVELEIFGPKTVISGFSFNQWKACFLESHRCSLEKKQFFEYLLPDQGKTQEITLSLNWLDSLEANSPKGVHLNLKTKTYQIDRYAIITDSGKVQIFSMKSVLNPVGLQAKDQFLKTLASLKVKEDLADSRAWIQSKVTRVRLDDIRKISNPKLRLERLIQVQNWIYSLLSVDPTQPDPFFHLAGVSHLLAMELMKAPEKYFEHQEAWIQGLRPLFESLVRYAKDFKDNDVQTKNIESLLQDILYAQKKLSH